MELRVMEGQDNHLCRSLQNLLKCMCACAKSAHARPVCMTMWV